MVERKESRTNRKHFVFYWVDVLLNKNLLVQFSVLESAVRLIILNCVSVFTKCWNKCGLFFKINFENIMRNVGFSFTKIKDSWKYHEKVPVRKRNPIIFIWMANIQHCLLVSIVVHDISKRHKQNRKPLHVEHRVCRSSVEFNKYI